MPREGAFHHLIIVSYPRQDKRSKGNGCGIQHDFMLLTVSLTSIENLRNNFADIKEEAIGLAKKWGVIPEFFKKKRHRIVRQFFDDFNADEKLQDRERLFEVDVFKANVDVITTQLKNRFESQARPGIHKRRIWDCVYVPSLPVDLPDLRHRIEAAVARIASDTLNNAWDELAYRLDVCRVTNGVHIEHL
ncbi:uncharacterized protein TNCV_4045311 [Trichonephila clavipes]|nr:uncharacterized protein TNCV_4045311 [Trichonephila clavipes]